MKKSILSKTTAAALGVLFLIGAINSAAAAAAPAPQKVSITNVYYDPTRELYEQYNKLFQEYWLRETGQEVEITQSHGGSGKQARSVIEGNDADVVTLALEPSLISAKSRTGSLSLQLNVRIPSLSSK